MLSAVRAVRAVTLNGDDLPCKDEVNHLGTTLSSSCSTSKDTTIKRAKFIQRCYEINQEFAFASEEVKLKMLRIHNTAFFGSNSWNYDDEAVLKFGRPWNVNLRIMFDLPRDTHCWIVEDLSDGRHFLQMIFRRFGQFIKTIEKHKKPQICYLNNIVKNDVHSCTGSNIKTILKETLVDLRDQGVQALNDWRVYRTGNDWAIPLLRNLLQVRAGNWVVHYDHEDEETLADDDVKDMIVAACTG